MKPMSLLAIAVSVIPPFAPAATERVPLWPEGKIPLLQDHQKAAMVNEESAEGFRREEHAMPFLEWCEPPAEAGRTDVCMILISGGGYGNWCDVGLVNDWERKLTALGVTCVKLVYRTPRPKNLPFYATAWADGQRAVRLVRSEAGKRGFSPDRIGAMSMSAGSHLALLLATSSSTNAYERVDDLDDTPCNLNWACTLAIAYAITDGLGIPNTRDGDAIDAKLDPVFVFDDRTCPMWMSHGGNDPYSPAASCLVYRRLREKKIPAELHLYPDQGHGAFGFDRAVEFMRQMGFLGPLEPEVALMSRYPNDDARGDYLKENVWPEGRMPDPQKDQCNPTVEWHFPKERKTRAIQIIYSGGAYCGNDPDDFEVRPARRFLNARGMTVVTLRYRTPRPAAPLAKHTTAWEDLQRAIRIVRTKAPSFGLDPDRIGIMGSSAGGHLTLMGATSSRRHAYTPNLDDIDKASCAVQWGVAIYPAYALTDGVDQPNTPRGNADEARLVPELSFDLDTPPMLFVHGDVDGWAAMNSVKCWEQLRRMGIQGELHTLATRDHCFQLNASPGTGSYTYLDRIAEFLDAKGFTKP